MFQCELCPKKYQLEESFTVHKRSVHEDIKYDCSVCDYKATTKSSLTSHIRGFHGTTKIQCEQCEFQCKWKGTLKQHKARVHFGQSERFPCDKCPSTHSSLGNLKVHDKSEHQNITFDCIQCGKVSNKNGDLAFTSNLSMTGRKKAVRSVGSRHFSWQIT